MRNSIPQNRPQTWQTALLKVSVVSIVVTAVLGTTPTLIAAADTSLFPKLSKVKETAIPKDVDLLSIGLNDDVYQVLNDRMTNLRLLDSDGNEIPYVIRQQLIPKTREVTTPIPSETLSLKQNKDDNSIEVIIENTHKKVPNRLQVITGAKNFEKQVKLLGSDDQTNWHPLSAKDKIYDYSRIINLRNDVIKFAGPGYHYYKLVIGQFQEEKEATTREVTKENRKGTPFSEVERSRLRREIVKINSIQLAITEAKTSGYQPRTGDYQTQTKSITNEGSKTVCLVDSPRQPLTAFVITTDNNNFIRDYQLQGSQDNDKWITITSGRLIKSDLPGFQHNHLTVGFAEKRYTHYRLTIDNGDSPALHVGTITAKGNLYEAQLLRSDLKTASLTCYYGGKKVPAPKYSVSGIIDKLKSPSKTRLDLAAAEKNPAFTGPSFAKSFLDNKGLFFTVIGLMVIILGWALYNVMKKMELPPEEE